MSGTKGIGGPAFGWVAWYDDPDIFVGNLNNLESFRALISERYRAHYDRGERLRSWVILGRFELDECGNFLKFGKFSVGYFIPKERFPDVPDILPLDDLESFLAKRFPDGNVPPWGATMVGNLPPSDRICPYCGKGWDIDNCYDFTTTHSEITITERFIGKTLDEARKILDSEGAGVHSYQPNMMVRNDRHIDLSPKYPEPQEWWQKGIIKNKDGWVGEAGPFIAGKYVVQNGDDIFFNVITFYHQGCYEMKKEKETSR